MNERWPDVSYCSIDGCTRTVQCVGKGWCSTHYMRWWRHGSVHHISPKGDSPGTESWNWKGQNITYRGAHGRVFRLWGVASAYPCVFCGKQAREWAYDSSDPTQQISPRGCGYSTHPEFYMPLCAPCHRGMDQRRDVCKNGHEMTPENTVRYPAEPTRRRCRKCERKRSKGSNQRRRTPRDRRGHQSPVS